MSDCIPHTYSKLNNTAKIYANALVMQEKKHMSNNAELNKPAKIGEEMNTVIDQAIERLNAEANKKGLSIAELARISGVSQPTAHRILSGQSDDPKFSNLEKLGKALDLSLLELFSNNNMIKQRVSALMKQREWTEAQTAENAGVAQSSVHRIITGEIDSPRYATLEKLAAAFGVTTTSITLGTESSDNSVREIRPNYNYNLSTPVTTLNLLSKGELPTDTGEMIRCPVLHGPQVYAIRIENDHMTAQHGNGDSFKRGTIVFIDPEQAITAQDGDFVLVKFTETSGYSFNKLIITPAGRYLGALANGIPIVDKPFVIVGKHIGSWVPPSQ